LQKDPTAACLALMSKCVNRGKVIRRFWGL